MNRLILTLFSFGLLVSCQNDTSFNERPLTGDLAMFQKQTSLDLGLTTIQSNSLSKSLQVEGGNFEKPGFLWLVARHLQENLPPAEKASLLEKIGNIEEHMLGHGMCIPLGLEVNFRHPMHPHPGMATPLLTDSQRPAFQQLMQAHFKVRCELIEARKQGLIPPHEFHRRMQENFNQLMREIVGGLLTPDQRMALGKIMEQQRMERQKHIQQGFGLLAAALQIKEILPAIVKISMETERDKSILFKQLHEGVIDQQTLIQSLQAACSGSSAQLAALLDARQNEIVKIYRGLSLRPQQQMMPGG